MPSDSLDVGVEGTRCFKGGVSVVNEIDVLTTHTWPLAFFTGTPTGCGTARGRTRPPD